MCSHHRKCGFSEGLTAFRACARWVACVACGGVRLPAPPLPRRDARSPPPPRASSNGGPRPSVPCVRSGRRQLGGVGGSPLSGRCRRPADGTSAGRRQRAAGCQTAVHCVRRRGAREAAADARIACRVRQPLLEHAGGRQRAVGRAGDRGAGRAEPAASDVAVGAVAHAVPGCGTGGHSSMLPHLLQATWRPGERRRIRRRICGEGARDKGVGAPCLVAKCGWAGDMLHEGNA
eukprot:366212-Chlamydomonas_euryale.AAC.37